MTTSILAGVTSGVSRSGVRMVLAALEKMGKTTMASAAPGALLVPLEVGYAGVNVNKTPMLQSFDEFLQLMSEITQLCQEGKPPCQTLVVDSTTAMERHIHDYVLRSDPAFKQGAKKTITMESAHGGYGKAYNLANDYFGGVLRNFDYLAVNYGINIVLTCHVFSSKVMDPTSGEYDSWDLLLHSPKNNKTYGKREIVTQWADVIGFLYEPVFVSKADGSTMSRAISQNKGRILGLSRTPSYTAGNRYRMDGEISIPGPPANGWNHFAKKLYDTCGVDVFTR